MGYYQELLLESAQQRLIDEKNLRKVERLFIYKDTNNEFIHAPQNLKEAIDIFKSSGILDILLEREKQLAFGLLSTLICVSSYFNSSVIALKQAVKNTDILNRSYGAVQQNLSISKSIFEQCKNNGLILYYIKELHVNRAGSSNYEAIMKDFERYIERTLSASKKQTLRKIFTASKP